MNRRHPALGLLRRWLQTVAFCLVLTGLLKWMAPHKDFGVTLVYSLCIGVLCWAIIEVGRWRFHGGDTGWPSGWRGFVVPLIAIVGSFFLGTTLADAIFGWSSWDRVGLSDLPRAVTVSLLAGVMGSYYAFTRWRAADLQSRMAESQKLATEAQLQLLHSQLEPHMLFNTLANLRALIGIDPAAAQTMLDRLNAYLRATLAGSRATTHTLQAEFDRLADYLSLMQIRLGDRLRFTLDLAPECAGRVIPALLLQPLVENSIRHGIEPAVAGGHVSVRARRSDDGAMLVLDVIDSGVGLAGEGLNDAPSASRRSVGLSLVRERLAAAYGGVAETPNPTETQSGWAKNAIKNIAFFALSAADASHGTRACIRIPWDATAPEEAA